MLFGPGQIELPDFTGLLHSRRGSRRRVDRFDPHKVLPRRRARVPIDGEAAVVDLAKRRNPIGFRLWVERDLAFGERGTVESDFARDRLTRTGILIRPSATRDAHCEARRQKQVTSTQQHPLEHRFELPRSR